MPKPPKGMFRRPGRSAWYTRRRVNGKDRWIALGADFGVAVNRLREIQNRGVPVDRMTVEQACARWLETYAANERSERFRKHTAARFARYLNPFMGRVQLARLRGDEVREYRTHLEGYGLAPETVRHALSDLRCVLLWCVDSGKLDRSPFPRRVMPKIELRAPNRLTDDEVDAVLRIPEPHAFALRLALGTGLRWGELVRAQAAHLERDLLLVPKSKTGEFRRVPVSPELQGEIRRRVGRLVPFECAAAFARAVRRLSGVERFHVHQTRHTFACRWVDAGRSIDVLREILGHKSVKTTERYGKPSIEFIRSEASR